MNQFMSEKEKEEIKETRRRNLKRAAALAGIIALVARRIRTRRRKREAESC